jgi:DNA-binding winged helix-turn-helix (wHTH) protein
METTARPLKALRFGPFELYRDQEKLFRNGVAVKLQDQPLKLLVLLLERRGEIVSREEMRVWLWPADSFGDFDNGLNVAVKKLRTALEDDSDQPRYVETIPRRGYRFIAEVAEVDPSVAEQAASTPSAFVVETI